MFLFVITYYYYNSRVNRLYKLQRLAGRPLQQDDAARERVRAGIVERKRKVGVRVSKNREEQANSMLITNEAYKLSAYLRRKILLKRRY